jgi:hypothetical protein
MAACSTAPPAAVDVPIPVSCVREAPRAPALVTDAELRAMNEYQLPLALWRDRLQRRSYERELEAVVQACSQAPAAAEPAPR